jgi:hypothetical protein
MNTADPNLPLLESVVRALGPPKVLPAEAAAETALSREF